MITSVFTLSPSFQIRATIFSFFPYSIEDCTPAVGTRCRGHMHGTHRSQPPNSPSHESCQSNNLCCYYLRLKKVNVFTFHIFRNERVYLFSEHVHLFTERVHFCQTQTPHPPLTKKGGIFVALVALVALCHEACLQAAGTPRQTLGKSVAVLSRFPPIPFTYTYSKNRGRVCNIVINCLGAACGAALSILQPLFGRCNITWCL